MRSSSFGIGLLVFLMIVASGFRLAGADEGADAEAAWWNLKAQAESHAAAGRPRALVDAARGLLVDARELFGEEHEAVLTAHVLLALGQWELGAVASARQSLEVAHDLAVRLYGEDDWRVVDRRRALEDLAIREALSPDDQRDLAAARRDRMGAIQAFAEGRAGDAVRLLDRTCETCARVLGARHADTLAQRSDLGSLYARMGAWEECVPIWQAVLEVRIAVLGEVHPDTAKSLHDLAYASASSGRPEVAAQLWRRALASREVVFGKAHPETVVVLTNLGELFLQQRRYDEAETCLLEARRRLLDAEIDAGPDALQLLTALGRLYAAIGNHDRSAGFFRLEVADRRRGTESRTSALGVALSNLGHELGELGRLGEAEERLAEAVEILGATLGPSHPRTAAAQSLLGLVYREQGRYARAVELCREALAAKQAAFGAEHPETATALSILGLALLSRGPAAEAEAVTREALRIRRAVLGEEHPDTAESLLHWGTLLLEMARYAEAEVALLRALEVHRTVHGPAHPATLVCLQNLGSLYATVGDREKALTYLRPALATLRASWARDHPYLAGALHDLGATFQHAGEYVQATLLYEEALPIEERSRGPAHPAVARLLAGLSHAHAALGHHAAAEKHARRALAIRLETHGEDHPSTARALARLGEVHMLAGRYWEAHPLFRQALAACEASAEADERTTASVLVDLGGANVLMGDPEGALPFLGRALDLMVRMRGRDHPDTAEVLDALGLLFLDLGNWDQAASYLLRAYEIRGRVFPPAHPKTLLSVKNLAGLKFETGAFADAAALYEKALSLQRSRGAEAKPFEGLLCACAGMARTFAGDTALGEALLREGLSIPEVSGPIRIRTELALSHNLVQQGRRAEALPVLEGSLTRARRLLDLSFTTRSERQQLAMSETYRPALGAYLDLTRGEGPDTASAASASSVHDVVLAWKGAALAQQLSARLTRADPGQRERLEALSEISTRLVARSLSEPGPEDFAERARELGALMRRREELETELLEASAAFQEVRAVSRVSSADLARRLPGDDVCLLDFVSYGTTAEPSEEHLAVFVVRHGRPTMRVDLGPARVIATAARAWREALLRAPGTDPREAGDVVAGLLWRPLVRHVEGASIVLVSPDGPVSRVPFGALPGAEAGSFLLEERAFALVPVPQLLPALLHRDPIPRGSDGEEAPMLLVGDVDYDAPGGGAAPPAGAELRGRAADDEERPRFERLPATAREIDAVAEARRTASPAGPTRVFRGTEATEAVVRSEAPQSRYVHLATHGFFAPPTEGEPGAGTHARGNSLWGRPEMRSLPPALLSGLAFAGANRVPGPGEDDGLWTALEVSALDLSRVELAVLSACETGLGKVAGGEGVLGLQRALQVSGVRTSLSTLWSIPDAATAELMRRFYDNLWKRGLSPLQALRQAQLALLREGGSESGAVRGPLRTALGPRVEIPARLPPFFWGAFVLSGDWR